MTEATDATDATEPKPVAAPPPAARVWPKRLLKALVAALALAFVVWVVPIRDRCAPPPGGGAVVCEPGLASTVLHANLPLLGALFAIYMAGSLAWAARWRALLGLAGVPLPLLSAWRITLEAQAGGILLPGGVAGDALRVTYAKGRAPKADVAKIVASVFADRVVGLVTLAFLATAVALPTLGRGLGAFFHVVAAIPLCAGLGWIILRRPGLAQRPIFSRGIVGRVVRPMLEYAGSKDGPRALGTGLLYSLLVSLAQLVVIRLLVAALGVRPDHEAWVYIGTTLGMMVAALPLAPGAWGTADAAYVFFLGQAGVPASVALSTCLVYRMYWYASGLVGAGLAIARDTPRRRDE